MGIKTLTEYKPSRFEMVGDTINIYIYKEKSKWEVNEIIYKPEDIKKL